MAEHKDYWTTAGDQGAIRISEDVVASITALAASETEGVGGLYSSFTNDIASFLGKKKLSKGVRVALGEEDTVEVESCYLAQFGYNISEVAKKVQQAIRSSIEAMTGLKTSSINIYVGGVTFNEPEEAAPAAEETDENA